MTISVPTWSIDGNIASTKRRETRSVSKEHAAIQQGLAYAAGFDNDPGRWQPDFPA
jgi:hypothetical protein